MEMVIQEKSIVLYVYPMKDNWVKRSIFGF